MVETALLLALAVHTLAAAAPGELVAERGARLVLATGLTYDVRGPLERTDCCYVFRDARGRLLSVREGEVREVVPLPSAPPPLPAVGAPAAPADRAESTIRYTNADLRPIPATAATEEPVTVEAPPPRPSAIVEGVPLVVPEDDVRLEYGGHDESWWRESTTRLREEIAALEHEENTVYRFMICAQHRIPIDSPACTLRLLPLVPDPANREARRLAAKLAEAREALERRKAELTALLDRALELGVPGSWVLDATSGL